MWNRLRVREPGKPLFRRQHPVGRYVLDFYCPAAKLALEIDGAGHGFGDQPGKDIRRDQWLGTQGIGVLRVQAVEVLKDADAVANYVQLTANARESGSP